MIKLNYPTFWQNKSIISYLLLPFAFVYSVLAYLRYFLVRKHKLQGKVICVGNNTVGGTGKTQVVIKLAQKFTEKKLNFVIISKGYGGSYKFPQIIEEHMNPIITGDEALELSKYGKTIIAKKVIDTIPILNKIKPDIIIVDDGMQNPSFHKDYTIITIDGERGYGNGFPIPAGPIRMPIINKADKIIITKTRLQEHSLLNIKNVINAYIKPSITVDKNLKYYAFAGIGNPQKFFDLIESDGINLVKTKIFPDHYLYTENDINDLKNEARKLDAILITTVKDYVKLPKDNSSILCYKVILDIEDEDQFINSIYEKLF